MNVGASSQSPLANGLRGDSLIDALDQADVLGRGGASFPLARKWRTVQARSHGRAVVLANGAEGEPLSRKDRTLLADRPGLVIDGALLAADAVGASDIIFYVGREHRSALTSLRRAMGDRSERLAKTARIVEAPLGYVSGEESAAVNFLNSGDARPTATPPRPFERGVGGRPTLVQNVESLATAAMVANGSDQRTRLYTASGAVHRAGVYELSTVASPAEIARCAGGLREDVQAFLIGGYFGAWVSADKLAARDLKAGCGVLHFLAARQCGVDATARIMHYLASQSARQCGPCVFGLSAIAASMSRLVARTPQGEDLLRVRRWSGILSGRGACKHPDGATALLRSALAVFAADFEAHQRRRCLISDAIQQPLVAAVA